MKIYITCKANWLVIETEQVIMPIHIVTKFGEDPIKTVPLREWTPF